MGAGIYYFLFVPLSPVSARAELLRVRAAAATREIAVCLTAVLLMGLGAIQSVPATVEVVLAGHVQVAPSPLPDGLELGRADHLPLMDVSAAPVQGAAPDPLAPAVPAVPALPALPVGRWLPTGTGMWLHDWRRSDNGDARAVVTRAQQTGLSHLYVQTGSSKKGWIGEEVLSQLMPATIGTDLKVIAWDFPKLIDPEADAHRMMVAATWSRPGVPRVAAVAPDIETASEGTRITADAVRRYYTALRAILPPEIAILATVPWPSEKRIGTYPYAETAPHADAWIPMVYWYNRSPAAIAAASMSFLGQFGKPVMPVGQGYDGRIDAPYLPADPAPDQSVQAFVDVACAGGARSISLWSWQTTGPLQWGVLARAGAAFAPVPEPVPSLLDQLRAILGPGEPSDRRRTVGG